MTAYFPHQPALYSISYVKSCSKSGVSVPASSPSALSQALSPFCIPCSSRGTSPPSFGPSSHGASLPSVFDSAAVPSVPASLSDSHVIAGGRTADRFSTSCTTGRDSSSCTTSRDSSSRAPHPVHNIPQPMHKAIYVKEKIAFPLVFPLIISPFDGLSG